MWKKGIAAACGAALLLTGVVLLRGVSSPASDAAPLPSAKTVQSPGGAAPSLQISADPIESESRDAERAPAPSGPSAPVWRVLGESHSDVAKERSALIAAFRGAPPCVERWCDDGRATLGAWQSAVAAKVPGAVTADAIECSSAGCWMRVAVIDTNKWREVSAALPAVTAEKAWQGPSILGGPDFQTQRGAVISIWAILPNVVSTQTLDEKGVE